MFADDEDREDTPDREDARDEMPMRRDGRGTGKRMRHAVPLVMIMVAARGKGSRGKSRR